MIFHLYLDFFIDHIFSTRSQRYIVQRCTSLHGALVHCTTAKKIGEVIGKTSIKKCFLPGRFSLARRMIVLKVLNNGNAAPMLFPRLLLFASSPSTPSHHKAVSMISFLTEALVQIQIEKIDQIK